MRMGNDGVRCWAIRTSNVVAVPRRYGKRTVEVVAGRRLGDADEQRRGSATTLRWWGKVIVLIPTGGIVEDIPLNVFECLLITDNEVVKAGLPSKWFGVYALNHSATS